MFGVRSLSKSCGRGFGKCKSTSWWDKEIESRECSIWARRRAGWVWDGLSSRDLGYSTNQVVGAGLGFLCHVIFYGRLLLKIRRFCGSSEVIGEGNKVNMRVRMWDRCVTDILLR